MSSAWRSFAIACIKIPELGYEEFKTAALIREELTRLEIDFIPGTADAPTATIAHIGDISKPVHCAAGRYRCVADRRADRAALRLDAPWPDARVRARRARDGAARRCRGAAADGGQAAGVREADFPTRRGGRRRGAAAGAGGGARRDDRAEGGARSLACTAGPGLPVGMVSTKPGPVLAATDTFEARFIGVGCHGAFPHLGRDPIVTACEAVLNLQQFVSREIDPTEPAVVTVGTFNSGTGDKRDPRHRHHRRHRAHARARGARADRQIHPPPLRGHRGGERMPRPCSRGPTATRRRSTTRRWPHTLSKPPAAR